MIITLINQDEKFPLATLGVFYLLPAIASKAFFLSIIDAKLEPLEYQSKGQEQPFRFLTLSDIDSIKTYLNGLMSEKRDKFYLNLWVVNENSALLEKLDEVANDLQFYEDRVHERRNILIINEYRKSHSVKLRPGWTAIHNRNVADRIKKGEEDHPYKDVLFFLLALMDWSSRSSQRKKNLDNLFQYQYFALSPDDFKAVDLVFKDVEKQRIANLFEEEIRLAQQQALEKMKEPAATESPLSFESDLSQIAGLTAEIPLVKNIVTQLLGGCREMAGKHWHQSREELETEMQAAEEAALKKFMRARNLNVFNSDSSLRNTAASVAQLSLDQVHALQEKVQQRSAKLYQDLQITIQVKIQDIVNKWQEVQIAFHQLRKFCLVDKIPTMVYGIFLVLIYTLGLVYFGLNFHSYLPLINQLMPGLQSIRLYEVLFWSIFSGLPAVTACGLLIHEKIVLARLQSNLIDAVNGLTRAKREELESIWSRQKGEMQLAYLAKLQVLLERRASELEEKEKHRQGTIAFFREMVKELNIQLPQGQPAPSSHEDVFAVYHPPDGDTCRLKLTTDSSSQEFDAHFFHGDPGKHANISITLAPLKT